MFLQTRLVDHRCFVKSMKKCLDQFCMNCLHPVSQNLLQLPDTWRKFGFNRYETCLPGIDYCYYGVGLIYFVD